MWFSHPRCFEAGCLRAKPHKEYAIGCQPKQDKAKPRPDIHVCSARTFLRLCQKPGHEGFVYTPRYNADGIVNLNAASIEKQFYAANVGSATDEDFRKFMAEKPDYIREERLRRLPKEHHWVEELFDKSKAKELPPRRPEDHAINLVPGAKLLELKSYRPHSQPENEAIQKYVEEHLGKGFIRPSSSKVTAPLLVVRKPGGGLRVCVDYRALNAITKKSRYPIPNINETLSRLGRAKIFTKLDVVAAFNRIRIKEGHEYLTAFNTRYGQFEYLVMPFGLCNAPGTFQSFINNSVLEYLDRFCTAYLDDVLLYSENEEEHAENVNRVLRRLRERELHLDLDKCEFNVRSVKYLGLIVGTDGIKMDPEKVEAILSWETPFSVKDVQAFLGFANFYRRFIHNFSQVARLLAEMTKGKHFTTRNGRKKIRY